ncbi:MAG: phosphotransferase [Syntrophales bacterium]|nr:phosphotransferase [Syntrophales bacterium]
MPKFPDDLITWALFHLDLKADDSFTVRPLSRGGSERNFYRLSWDDRSVFLMHYLKERRENAYYVPIGRFLKGIDVAVPEIFHHDAEKGFIVMEDLGDRDMWSYRLASPDILLHLYKRTLDLVHILHAYPLESFPRSTVPLMEGFDGALYRWERDYFRENFVAGVCGIRLGPREVQSLENELDALAKRLEMADQSLVHRDLQSQNIMIRDGKPVFIDFQGMRVGDPLYDLGSLLYDPYVEMDGGMRDILLSYYYEISGKSIDWTSFREMFREASAQRLMQALGAYGFLGLKRGRPGFLKHIGHGLRNLLEVTQDAADLPLLYGLTRQCIDIIGDQPFSDSP